MTNIVTKEDGQYKMIKIKEKPQKEGYEIITTKNGQQRYKKILNDQQRQIKKQQFIQNVTKGAVNMTKSYAAANELAFQNQTNEFQMIRQQLDDLKKSIIQKEVHVEQSPVKLDVKMDESVQKIVESSAKLNIMTDSSVQKPVEKIESKPIEEVPVKNDFQKQLIQERRTSPSPRLAELNQQPVIVQQQVKQQHKNPALRKFGF